VSWGFAGKAQGKSSSTTEHGSRDDVEIENEEIIRLSIVASVHVALSKCGVEYMDALA
jgi:hypothetical protein